MTKEFETIDIKEIDSNINLEGTEVKINLKKGYYRINKENHTKAVRIGLNERIYRTTGMKEEEINTRKIKIKNALKLFIENGIYKKNRFYDITKNIETKKKYQKSPLDYHNSKINISCNPFDWFIYVWIYEKELFIDNKEYFEEIALIENYFNSIKKRDEEPFTFEKIGGYVYYEYTPKGEGFSFLGEVDLVTTDSLYYLAVDEQYSLTYAAVYLNILNIFYKKEHLRVLHVTKSGHKEIVECEKARNIQDIFYANSTTRKIPIKNLPEWGKVRKAKETCFDVLDYIKKVIKKEENYFLGIDLNLLTLCLTGSTYYLISYDIKKTKDYIATKLISIMEIIKKVSIYYSKEHVTIFLKDLSLGCKGIALQELNKLKDKNKLDLYFEKVKNTSEDFKIAIEQIESEAQTKNKWRADYRVYSLKMNLNEAQKTKLETFLFDNGYIEKKTLKEAREIGPRDILDRVNISNSAFTKKKDVFQFGRTYKKENNYFGCIQADCFLPSTIIDALPYCKYDGEKVIYYCIDVILKCTFLGDEKTYKITLKDEVEIEEEEREKSNKRLTLFFDTFGITRANFNLKQWIGKKGYVGIEGRDDEVTGVKSRFREQKGKGVFYLTQHEEECPAFIEYISLI